MENEPAAATATVAKPDTVEMIVTAPFLYENEVRPIGATITATKPVAMDLYRNGIADYANAEAEKVAVEAEATAAADAIRSRRPARGASATPAVQPVEHKGT